MEIQAKLLSARPSTGVSSVRSVSSRERHACRILLVVSGTYHDKCHREPWTVLRIRMPEMVHGLATLLEETKQMTEARRRLEIESRTRRAL